MAAFTAHVQAFATIMTGRRYRHLEQWITSVATGEPAHQSFVTGLRAESPSAAARTAAATE